MFKLNIFFIGDGQYGKWSDWSKCSKSCGNGLQERKRLCDSPAPSNGGKSCEGVDLERQECNEGKCAGMKMLGVT